MFPILLFVIFTMSENAYIKKNLKRKKKESKTKKLYVLKEHNQLVGVPFKVSYNKNKF